VLAKELAYYVLTFGRPLIRTASSALSVAASLNSWPGHLCKHRMSSDEYEVQLDHSTERLSTRRKKNRNAEYIIRIKRLTRAGLNQLANHYRDMVRASILSRVYRRSCQRQTMMAHTYTDAVAVNARLANKRRLRLNANIKSNSRHARALS
jgi:hypothetical protein